VNQTLHSKDSIPTKHRTAIFDLMDLCHIDQAYPGSNDGSLLDHYLVGTRFLVDSAAKVSFLKEKITKHDSRIGRLLDLRVGKTRSPESRQNFRSLGNGHTQHVKKMQFLCNFAAALAFLNANEEIFEPGLQS
jgi:hypothetical protein